MGLETGTYLNDLVTTNPDGSTDAKSEGDNHIRLIKSTLKATFPGMAGAAWRVQTKAADYPLAATDNMTQITVTAAATISGTAATLGNGFAVVIYNSHTAAITIPGSYNLSPANGVLLVCNGSTFGHFPFAINGPTRLGLVALSGSSVTFTELFPSVYRSYKLIVTGAKLASGSGTIALRSGVGSIDSGNRYAYGRTEQLATGTTSYSASTGDNAAPLASTITTFASRFTADFSFGDTHLQGSFNCTFYTGAAWAQSFGFFDYAPASGTIDRIQFLTASGTFAAGVAELYGLY